MMLKCATCGTREEGKRYWLQGTEGPVACQDCAPVGSIRNDHPWVDVEALEARIVELEEQIASHRCCRNESGCIA